MVMVKEVTRYVDQRMSLARNQISLTVAMDGKSLFDMLDVNTDRRLSPREFREAMSHLEEWDINQDGRLVLAEIPSKYKLTFSLGQSLLFPGGAMAAQPENMEARRPDANRDAPVWFQKMDRNRDGDISNREFLGPPTAFQSIDSNSDGLIDVEEAKAIDTTSP
jgi:Ca2+-binding EF-hand superfamily protein